MDGQDDHRVFCHQMNDAKDNCRTPIFKSDLDGHQTEDAEDVLLPPPHHQLTTSCPIVHQRARSFRLLHHPLRPRSESFPSGPQKSPSNGCRWLHCDAEGGRSRLSGPCPRKWFDDLVVFHMRSDIYAVWPLCRLRRWRYTRQHTANKKLPCIWLDRPLWITFTVAPFDNMV